MNKRAGRILLLFLLAGVQWRCAGEGETAESGAVATAPAPELAVPMTQVTVADWPVTIPISGSLRSRSNVEVKAEVGGRLIETFFEEGDRVAKDQLLAEIDPVNYRLAGEQARAALAVTEAGLERARVMLDYNRREKERADNLLRTGGITEKDHQAALMGVREGEAQVKLAEAQCEQARAAIAIAEKALRDCRIIAPAAGTVRRRNVDRGTLVSPGTAIYSLVDNARLELECLVPSYQLADVHLGQRARFTTPTWGERRFEGGVGAINPMVESDNRSVKVLVEIENQDGALRSGMYARGEIEVRIELQALVIPRSALVMEQEETGVGNVYVVVDGRARLRRVTVGASRQDQLWIREGLAQGDRVIVEIGPSLRDGLQVRAAQELPGEH